MDVGAVRSPDTSPLAWEDVVAGADGYVDCGIRRHRTKGGSRILVHMMAHQARLDDTNVFVAAAFDVTGTSYDGPRAEALLAITELSDGVPIESFLRTAIELVADAVDSADAAMILIGGDDADAVEVICSTCDSGSPDTMHPIPATLRTMRDDLRVFGAEPSPVLPPWMPGLGEGRQRMLGVPVMERGTLAAAVVVADKPEEYSSHDVVTLRALAQLMFQVLQLERSRREAASAEKRQEQTMWSIVEALTKTIELRDPYTAGHQRRVAALAVEIGHELGIAAHRLNGIYAAGMLHDVGKIGVPYELLVKPTRLSVLEHGLIRTHAQVGADLLADVVFPWPVAEMVRQHHERVDGSGYPDGLRGDEILFGARIIAVADVVDAMVSDRPYRPALGMGSALDELVRGSGTIFEPIVVGACRRVIERYEGRLPEFAPRQLDG